MKARRITRSRRHERSEPAHPAAHLSATCLRQSRDAPLQLAPGQQIDIAAHGVGKAAIGRVQFVGSNESASKCGQRSHFDVQTGEGTAFSLARASANAGN